MSKVLDQQVAAKQYQRNLDKDANKAYINQVGIQVEIQRKKEQEQVAQRQAKLNAHQEDLKRQMTDKIATQHYRSGPEKVDGFQERQIRKHQLGGQMNQHEARMNRDIMWKIAERKRSSSQVRLDIGADSAQNAYS